MSKVRNLNLIRNVHFELKFERRYLDRVYAKLHRDASFEMRISNDGPELFSSYASRKSHSEITVWMPQPLNRDLGAELSDLLTTSAYIPRAAYVQKHRKCELRAYLIGRVPRHSSPAGMRNPKFGLSCFHCVIQISQLLLSCVHCVNQITHVALVWKQSKSRNESHNKVMAFMGHPRHSTEIVAWGNAWAEKNRNWRCSRDYDSTQIEALGERRRKETNKLMFQLGFVGGC